MRKKEKEKPKKLSKDEKKSSLLFRKIDTVKVLKISRPKPERISV